MLNATLSTYGANQDGQVKKEPSTANKYEESKGPSLAHSRPFPGQ